MKTNTFIKTFIMLLFSFLVVFFLNAYISNQRFSSMYVDENVDAVKTAILESQNQVLNGTPLSNTSLDDLSSETTFIRYQNFTITEEIGPNFINEDDIIDFVIDMDVNTDSIKEGNLTYFIEQVDDIYHINYIYEYEFGDWLIVRTKIQSLTNVDRVLSNLLQEQTLYIVLVVIAISYFISRSISKPLKQINRYAKKVSNLQFDEPLNLKRRDEFREINTSLNEMTFNLQKTYEELESLNQELTSDLDQEKIQ